MACDFLRIGPVDSAGTWLEIPVAPGSARRTPDHTVGEVTRAYDGSARSTVQTVKDRISVETVPLSIADAQALVAAITPGATIGLDGPVVDDVPMTVIPLPPSITYAAAPGTHLRVVSLEFVEA